MDYDFRAIEERWRKYWAEHKTYRAEEHSSKPKYYVLDMFPYPSGAGLHVGHPLGYIASDIYSRYKRLRGYNVLHPMGYDAFGLPAEQYAIQTGQHPEKTTDANIARYRSQLDRIGLSFDWDREVRTCDPAYYKWTQWAFIKMFKSYYSTKYDKARPIEELVAAFEENGTEGIAAAGSKELRFTADEWRGFTDKERADVLMNYRIAYQADSYVNWCPGLGTVLANDEVKDGLSVRGGYPVEQRKMRQWQLRTSAYAGRLLSSLDGLDWTDSLKEMQRNWIGRSEGAELWFKVYNGDSSHDVSVFTTRPDTIYGLSFMVMAPESEWVSRLTTEGQNAEVETYLEKVGRKTERERMAQKEVTGVFTGSYAESPVTGKRVPVWVSEYVLAGYGTGVVMGVPAHDSRDYAFAKKFGLDITPIIAGADVSEHSVDAKEGKMCNSGFLDGLDVKEAIKAATKYFEDKGIGHHRVTYRLRDAIFSRQRYWGEPIPIYYKNGIATPLPYEALPLALPEMTDFKPTANGEPPLSKVQGWTYDGYPLETTTMPGFAGSSAYYLRYMDPHNDEALVSKDADEYWRSVDLYVGGTEHATGHLIYSRFWDKVLYDLGYVCEDEPFRKLINQGMIQGRSNFVYRIVGTNKYVSAGLKGQYETQEIHVDINLVRNDVLDIDKFRTWRPEFADAEFVLEDGKYICGWAVEKMSKSMYNVVNPDDICNGYGADTLRLFEMFLGPVEQSKPWDTKNIEGVSRFLRKFWKLFYDGDASLVTDDEPTAAELKALHQQIAKEQSDIEAFSYNTSISAFMITINTLTELGCHKKKVLEPLVVLLAPFAPHMAEELWHSLGHSGSVNYAAWPEYNPDYTKEDECTYAVSFNGKTRFTVELPKSLSREDVQKEVMAMDKAVKYLEGKTVVKVVVVQGKIVNIVLK